MAEGSDGAGDFADAQIFRRGVEAHQIALHLVVPQRQLQAEGNGLGVHAVGAADLDGVFEFERPPLQRFEQRLAIFLEHRRGLLEHQRLRGIDHVVRSQPVMQPARSVGLAGGGHFLGDGGGEGDDVVLHFALDLVNARDVEGGMLAQRARGLRGNFAGLGQRFARGQFDGEPLLEAVLVAKDAAHFGPGISWDHFSYVQVNRQNTRRADRADVLGSAITSRVKRLRPSSACAAIRRTISG